MIGNYGEVFKSIRKEKGMTLKELAELSKQFGKGYKAGKSNISKFEGTSTDISLPRLATLLNILNVSIEEFSKRAEELENTISEEMNGIARAFKNKDINSLKYLSERYKGTSEDLPRNRHLHIVCKALLSRLNKESVSSQELEEIETYFVKVEHWHFYELSLFTDTMFLFSPHQINIILERASSRIYNYIDLGYYFDYFAIMLSNAITLFLETDNREYAQKYLKKLETHFKPE